MPSYSYNTYLYGSIDNKNINRLKSTFNHLNLCDSESNIYRIHLYIRPNGKYSHPTTKIFANLSTHDGVMMIHKNTSWK